jgi:hypothetical protein
MVSFALHVICFVLNHRFSFRVIFSQSPFWYDFMFSHIPSGLTYPDYILLEAIMANLSLFGSPDANQFFYRDMLLYAQFHLDPRPIRVVAIEALEVRRIMWLECILAHNVHMLDQD